VVQKRHAVAGAESGDSGRGDGTGRAGRAGRSGSVGMLCCLVVDGQDGRTGKTRTPGWAGAPEQRKIWIWAQGAQEEARAPSIRATDNGAGSGGSEVGVKERAWITDGS